MTRKELEKLLNSNGYTYKIVDKRVVINHNGDVFLYRITTLPKNTVFKNKGYVYLDGITTLPENTVFKNKGNVYLDSITTLHEDTVFKNKGYVYLPRITTLPEGTLFKNNGYVYLSRINGKIIYQCQELELLNIDGHTMIIDSRKAVNNTTIMRCRYFGGVSLSELNKCYIASEGDYHAHGDTVKSAIADLRFKIMQESMDIDEIVSMIKEKGKMTVNDYRLLTGACKEGCKQFLSQHGITSETLTIAEVITLTKDAYGGQKVAELLAFC